MSTLHFESMRSVVLIFRESFLVGGKLQILCELFVFRMLHYAVNILLLFVIAIPCRRSAPHIWWLALALFCRGSLTVVEMIVTAVFRFILTPLCLLSALFIFELLHFTLILIPNQVYSALTRCFAYFLDMAAHFGSVLNSINIPPPPPDTDNASIPGSDIINYDIRPLSKAEVDRIPLVIYIPPPPSSSDVGSSGHTARRDSSGARKQEQDLKDDGYSSPLASRFVDPGHICSEDIDNSWETGFEKGEFPFIQLEASRASCAICLCDFIPARRKNSSDSAEAKNDAQPGESLKSDEKSNTENNNASSGTEAEVNRCDSLRILACRHVFHAECLEPWLLGASGRCPTCQQTVEVDAIDPEIFKSERRTCSCIRDLDKTGKAHISILIHIGPNSDVYKGTFLHDDDSVSPVALKVIRIRTKRGKTHDSKRLYKRFRRVLRVSSHLHHPNILPLIGFAKGSNLTELPMLITPWYEDGNVVEYLELNPHASRPHL
ncbi:hypothetical protein FRC02_004344, partial [Tulasnella sp. 418]